MHFRARGENEPTCASNGRGATILCALALFLLSPAASLAGPQASAGSWSATGSLVTARTGHTATVLPDGRVLVVGGRHASTTFASAELFDPATGRWQPTSPMGNSRSSHTATRLPDGRVLVVGGVQSLDISFQFLRSAEIYDPASGAWQATGSLLEARGSHQASVLPDGTVLVAGGFGRTEQNAIASAEVFDPASGTWRAAGRLGKPRYAHTLTQLQDGRVLAAGGVEEETGEVATNTAELYDPVSDSWTPVGALPRAVAYHTATLVPGGRVLLAGGYIASFPTGAARVETMGEALLFDPASGTWSVIANLAFARSLHTATALASGEVLLVGGTLWSGTYPGITNADVGGVEVYAPAHGTWSTAGSLLAPRTGHSATLLADGRVLVAGGSTNGFPLDSAELYTPTAAIDADYSGGWFDPAQNGHGIFIQVLPGNRILAWWFAFNPTGTEQAWFGGVGTYSGNTATIDTVVQTTGGRWIPNFNPATVVHNPWGRFTLTFSDRDHGRIDFESVRGYGTGSMSLTRLTQAAAASAVETSIGSPGAVTTDNAGNVYFSSSPNLVFRLDAQGALARIAGSGPAGYSGDGGPALLAQLNFPLSYPELVNDPIDFYELTGALAVDPVGNLYIADAYNNRVRRIDPAGIITTFAGDGVRGNTGDGGPAGSARFWWPQGVAVDAAGNVLISDANGTLRRVSPSGIVSTLTSNNCGPSFQGPGLCAPEQLAVDASGNAYVPDAYCRVRRVTPAGSVTTVAGNDRRPDGGFAFTCGYSGDGGPARDAALSNIPFSVAVDAAGNLFIADTYNSCIRKVTAGGIISTIAGRCESPGYAGDGGPATSARLDHPHGVAVDAGGRIHIADTGNQRIRKIGLDGAISTIAGNGAPGTIGPGYSGGWFDPAQNGHGIFIQVLPGARALAWWFGFTPEGTQQAWFGGVGTYSGNRLTISNVVQTTGGRFLPNFDSAQVTHRSWGSFTFTFTDCNHGRVDFASSLGYGTGSMQLTRLSLPAGQSCH